MLQVNFLPWRRVKQRRQVKRFIVLIFCYQACTVTTLWSLYLSIHSQQSLLATSLSEVEVLNRQMVESITRIRLHQDELAQLDANQQRIQQIKQSVNNLEQLFHYFEQILTLDVGFKRIDISGSRLNIEGRGVGYTSVVDFYQKTEGLSLIDSAQLGNVTASATDGSLFHFSLTADLSGVLP